MTMAKILDFIDVPVLSSVAIGITFTDVEMILKIVSLSLAIFYTGWKWIYEYKKKK